VFAADAQQIPGSTDVAFSWKKKQIDWNSFVYLTKKGGRVWCRNYLVDFSPFLYPFFRALLNFTNSTGQKGGERINGRCQSELKHAGAICCL
jgi:hypothetical protein